MLIGLLAGAGAALALAQDRDDSYVTRMANARAEQTETQAAAPVRVVPAANVNGLAQSFAQWKTLQQTDALPFDSYATFLLAHPGWPGESANRRAAERQAATGTASPSALIAYFRRFPPQSAAGGLAYARALAATGAIAQANDEARAAWRRGTLSASDEAALLQQFGGALRTEDHDARMDTLLWQGATSVAARQITLVSASQRPLLEARLAFRSGAANAADLAAQYDAIGERDAGYIADKATWLGRTNPLAARAWLARTRAPGINRPGNPEKFYLVLYATAKGAAADGQWQTAYDIARQVDDAYPAGTDVSTKSYGERDQYTNLVWLAGQAALNRLNRPADAMPLFDRYGRGTIAPQTRAKGFYWAARAAEAAGRTTEASGFFERAAGFRDQYYGLLANEHLARTLVPPPAVSASPASPAARAAFYGREVVRVAQFLGSINDWQDQTAFVKQIAADATSDTDHLLADELSRALGRPDLGVLVGRKAMINGLTEYVATGFPTVPVPGGYEDEWTMIHAISRQESNFDRMAVSGAGARGLMQLMPGTAREQAAKMGLAYNVGALTSDTGYNVQLGSTYFQRIFKQFGSYPLAIAAYNAGPGNVNKWLAANGDPRTGTVDWVDWVEAIPFSETRSYVQRVLENAVVYDLMNPQRARSRGPANLSWYLGRSKRG
ncbi:lytic transglycosylase domain-containing protein [Sphingomonas sp. 3P27F8]|uniref:lytic transglycosylase domain-containing protein n=1 Tax=Sphingomonas sp. 3P27F8 TaxID=2502213 RepID=UPI0020166A60|nr:lytic transglycosylase domain-containing protein [Sphingomonas sp. 3P27F8]